MHIFIYHVCVNEATNNSEVRHFLLYYETYLNLDCECNKRERDKMHIYLFNMCVLMRLQKLPSSKNVCCFLHRQKVSAF